LSKQQGYRLVKYIHLSYNIIKCLTTSMNLSKEIVLKFSYKKECFDVLAYLQTHENVCNKLVLRRRKQLKCE